MAETLPVTINGVGAKGQGREEEGSGDFERAAVLQWNVIIE